MNRTRLPVLLVAALALAGCGNKGPLVMPTAPVESAPVLPDDSAPAPAEPASTETPATAPVPAEEPAPDAAPQTEPASPPSEGGNG